MPRPVTPKPLSAHVTALVRMQAQLEADPEMSERVKRKLVKAVGELVAVFQEHR